MVQRKVDLRSVFLPSDGIAFVAILIGLFIALFLDEMAVRLIGLCIVVLGGVALFMMVSPRLTDMSMPRPPKPTETPSFMSETTRDGGRTRQVFDSLAYRATFGAEDQATADIDERQIQLFPGLMDVHETPAQTAPTLPASALHSVLDMEFADGQSSVRVVGVKSSRSVAAAPPLAIQARTQQRSSSPSIKQPNTTSESDILATGNADVVTNETQEGTVGESSEIRLSDEVIIRPRSSVQRDTSPEQPASGESEFDESPQDTDTSTITPQPPGAEATVLPTDKAEDAPSSYVQPERKQEIRISSVMVDDEEEMEVSEEPRKEFDYLLNRVLMVIRSATSARTAAFFWFNRERNQLVLEARISDATEKLTDKRKLPIGQDVVSQIALEGRPEIVTDILPTAELELLPYYKYRAGTASFVGVPVYFRGNVIGVLCADSIEENAYTDVTVGFFGHFTKLISGLVLSYTIKFDLQQNNTLLEAILQFRENVAQAEPGMRSIIASLFDVVINNMEVSTVGVCAYDRQQKLWTLRDVKSVMQEYGNLVGSPVDINNSLVGECLRSGQPIAISVESSVIRVSPDEPVVDLCQFIGAPMRSLLHTHGVLFLENQRGSISSHDVAMVELLADLAGEMIAGLRDQQIDNVNVPTLAESTSTDNNDAFYTRLQEEVSRSMDFELPLSLCLYAPDPLKGVSGTSEAEVRQQILDELVARLKDQIRDYDFLHVLDNSTIAVVVVATSGAATKLWAESVRRDTAATPFTADSKKVSATISAGIAELHVTDSWQTLIEHAEAALQISRQQENVVTVFS